METGSVQRGESRPFFPGDIPCALYPPLFMEDSSHRTVVALFAFVLSMGFLRFEIKSARLCLYRCRVYETMTHAMLNELIPLPAQQQVYHHRYHSVTTVGLTLGM